MVTLYLMGEKGLTVLKAILQYKSLIARVIIAQDKNVQKDFYDEIQKLCYENKILCCDKTEQSIVDSDYSFAIGWRWMIQTTCKNKLIILHDSLLPRYRGFAPLVNMLINREPCIGVTALFANDEFDRGDIILQKSIDVHYPLRISEAINKVSVLYSEIVTDILAMIQTRMPIPSIEQKEDNASYSLWRDEEDYAIDWYKEASYIQQFVYSVGFPFKGASSYIDGEMYRVLDCEIENDVVIENRCPGKVLFVKNGLPVVVCGKGLLRITKLVNIDGQESLPLKRYRIRFK